jgi:hypothetical protein
VKVVGKTSLKGTAKAGVGLDAPGSLGKRPDGFTAGSTVVGQKIHPDVPQHHEQFRFQRAQCEGMRIDALLGSRLHIIQHALPASGYPDL